MPTIATNTNDCRGNVHRRVAFVPIDFGARASARFNTGNSEKSNALGLRTLKRRKRRAPAAERGLQCRFDIAVQNHIEAG